MEVVIARTRLAAIEDAAMRARPRECCGLLIGRRRPPGSMPGCIEVTRSLDSPNKSPTPERAFEIDPQLWLDARSALGGGAAGEDDVVGLYHSHPAGPPEPSPRDRAASWGDGLVWLIVGLETGTPATAAFVSGAEAPAGDGGGCTFVPAALRIEERRGGKGAQEGAQGGRQDT